MDETQDGSVVGTATQARAAESASLASGDILAHRYRLVRLIARGGMGEVYEAQDLELGNAVAIKTLRAERMGEPGAIARLKAEILAARKVTHPNVVRIFDVGFHVLADQRELAFFTMELLDGETLDERIRKRGKLPVADALAIARQLAAALDAAHAAGLVHRDFKSQNVMLVGDRAIVTDFGLARDHLGGAAHATTEFVGTPAYMAPEQVTRAHGIGPASDVYAFGVVLFEMVTGTWPFRGETALATAAARLQQDPPSPRALVPELPASWDAAILRCLERDPSKRFRRASDVVAALVGRRPVRWRVIAAAGGAAAVIGGGIAIVRLRAVPSCGEPTLPDLYVDSAAPPGGTGSKACPLATVSDAVAHSGDRRVIHVAPGFYDRAHGERFPLELRGEVSLLGAGVDHTTIAGAGAWQAGAHGGTIDGTWQAAIVAGDTTRRIEIANLTLVSGLPSTQHDVGGILCTRGSTDEPNTWIHDVSIGPGFGTAIFAGTEEHPVATGCNLDVDHARLHDAATGIFQVGCGSGGGRVPVGVRVHRSTFQALHNDPVYPGAGITVWDCVRGLLVEDSTFADSDGGIVMIRHAPETLGPVVIRNNQFKLLSRVGIRMFLTVIAELRGNRFAEIAGADDNLGRAAALALVSDGLSAPAVTLRGNRFVENDIAVEVTSSAAIPAAFALDAGRDGERGDNVFACNSAPPQAGQPGGDIAIRAELAAGSRVELAGNVWDHAPPTQGVRAANGLDVLAPRALAAPDATAHDGGCLARVP